MKIGFIGLGAMGFPMARNLAAQHDVTVWNRTRSVAEKHAAAHGTRQARELGELSGCDVVVTILPTSREVDEVAEVLAPNLSSGSLWIDATSGDPGSSRETAHRLAETSIDFVDAPVSGGIPGAEGGTLTFMVGGSGAQFERARPLLESMGSKIIHTGPVGSGHAIKAISNTMMAANVWVASEALVALRKLGFDMKVALSVINGSSGRSNASENLLPMRVVDGQWPLAFKLALLDKDVRIATDITHDLHVSAPLLTLVNQLYTAARKRLGEDADYIEVAKFVAELSGERFE